jgi:hypothetical protein
MNQMFLDMAVGMGCSKLKGRFVSLPDAESPPLQGAEVGMSVGGGRWHIDDCLAGSRGGQFSLHLGGPAWQWVNRTQQDHHIEQYVYVAVSVDLEGPLYSAYDTNTKVTSVFLLPKGWAHVEPFKKLSIAAQPTGIGGALADLFFPAKVEAGVREAIETQGSTQLATQLGNGMTFTFTAAGQADLVVGRLPPGMVPRRPFPGPEAWVLNERQALHPGGITVAGPFPPGSLITLDAQVERGDAVRYHVYCSDPVVLDYRGFLDGGAFAPLVNQPDSAWIVPGPQVTTTTLPPQACPWVLATAVVAPPATPLSQGPPTTVKLRLRIGQH